MIDLKKHLSHYFSLIGIMIVTVVGFFVFSYDKNFQFAIITAASIAYFVWGIVHHIIHRDLNLQIMIEYAVVASLGFVIGISVIYRS
jgi:hypothetical protein